MLTRPVPPHPVGSDADPVPVWIGLGANLGERAAHLRAALVGMGALPGTRVLRISPLCI